MSEIPTAFVAGTAEFVRIESPEELAFWVATIEGTDGEHEISLIIEPPAAPEADVVEVAASIAADFDELVGDALEFLDEALRGPEWALSAADLARLAGADGAFGEPEAVIWGDGTWMMRFQESALSIAEEFGIGVNFVGRVPQTIEDLSESEEIE
ncbi:hypothetical protein D9V32_15790 [Mycetocola tolaasinivorans]|uniref:Uncharacterized protein n=1 Tax=Mycetocola tolaasinivorans TaxID=76635 RepID=A0A3L6ZVK0_9MICO|nr:hypothetical protein [Mycetocola tolaasinivorans]RLP71890.1 hypothetical protein D9V32_15790 [Mycetocola tolaasinivorans]